MRARIAESPKLADAYARQLYAIAAIKAADADESTTYRDKESRYSLLQIVWLSVGVAILAMLFVYLLVIR